VSILGRLRAGWQAATSNFQQPTQWLKGAVEGGTATVSGAAMSPSLALKQSAYFAAIRAISEDLGKLPLGIFERVGKGKRQRRELRDDLGVHKMLHDQFNVEMCACTGREMMTSWALSHGGGVAEIERDGAGRAIALWPIHPDRLDIHREDGVKVYDVHLDGARTLRLLQHEVLHVRGLGDDLNGFSIARQARESLGYTAAAEEYGATYLGNDATMGNVVIPPAAMKPQDRVTFQNAIQKAVSGTKRFRFLVMPSGTTDVKRVAIPAKDVQFLETRQFQVEEMARWFRIPPHKLQHLLHGTFSNISEQNIEYVVDTLMPWMVRWEQEIRAKLFGVVGTRRLFAKHNANALLRGDFATRTEGYRTLISTGVMTPNQARALEDENPSDDLGADLLWMQGAMKPLEQLAEEPEPPPVMTGGLLPPGVQPPPGEGPAPEEDDDEARFRPLFLDAAQRAVRREMKAVAKPAQRLAGDYPAFLGWANKFYSDQRSYILNAFGALLEAFDADSAAVSVYLDGWQRHRLDTAAEAFRAGEIDQFISYEPEAAESLATGILQTLEARNGHQRLCT
jgi:HK97 family phage portal protein